jgi:hypothetical protein
MSVAPFCHPVRCHTNITVCNIAFAYVESVNISILG